MRSFVQDFSLQGLFLNIELAPVTLLRPPSVATATVKLSVMPTSLTGYHWYCGQLSTYLYREINRERYCTYRKIHMRVSICTRYICYKVIHACIFTYIQSCIYIFIYIYILYRMLYLYNTYRHTHTTIHIGFYIYIYGEFFKGNVHPVPQTWKHLSRP